jgi:hypothetical protein
MLKAVLAAGAIILHIAASAAPASANTKFYTRLSCNQEGWPKPRQLKKVTRLRDTTGYCPSGWAVVTPGKDCSRVTDCERTCRCG